MNNLGSFFRRRGAWRLPVWSLVPLLAANVAFAEDKCLETKGAAAILNNDLASAKLEASARARWEAIEKAGGVEVRSQTLVENSSLLDDLISVKARGTITSSETVAEKRESDLYTVTVKTCVEPAKATDVVASLALNNSVAVFVPARKPRSIQESESTTVTNGVRSRQSNVKTTEEQEETNVFSETLIGKLVDQGYKVTDLALNHGVDTEGVEKAMKSGNLLTMRSLVTKFMTNVVLVGKVDYTVSQRKGEDIGYEVEMPYNRVTVRLSYRLLRNDPESGGMVILGAGTAEAKGSAGSIEDAAADGLQQLTEKEVPALMERFAKHVKGVSRKITVKVEGLDGLEGTFDAKRMLNGITWVSDVEAVGLNEYLVTYPENSIYLANSLSRQPKLKLTDYSPYQIRLAYKK